MSTATIVEAEAPGATATPTMETTMITSSDVDANHHIAATPSSVSSGVHIVIGRDALLHDELIEEEDHAVPTPPTNPATVPATWSTTASPPAQERHAIDAETWGAAALGSAAAVVGASVLALSLPATLMATAATGATFAYHAAKGSESTTAPSAPDAKEARIALAVRQAGGGVAKVFAATRNAMARAVQVNEEYQVVPRVTAVASVRSFRSRQHTVPQQLTPSGIPRILQGPCGVRHRT